MLFAALATVTSMAMSACSDKAPGEAHDAGGPIDAASQADAHTTDDANVTADAAVNDASGDAAIASEATLPSIGSRECTIDVTAYGIHNDDRADTDEDDTIVSTNTDNLQRAIDALVTDGCDRIVLPAGTYRVGKRVNAEYSVGLELRSGTAFVMNAGATVHLVSDTRSSCALSIWDQTDVAILGGTVRGDRDTHALLTAADEGSGICVQRASARILVEGVTIEEANGDGVMVVPNLPNSDVHSCDDITIRGNRFDHNRRNNITLAGSARVVVEDNDIAHAGGAAPDTGIEPGAGLDIESPWGQGYVNDGIYVRRNTFHHNQYADLISNDGTNVVFEDNTLSNGDDFIYRDGPIVLWKKTDTIVRRNTVTNTRGTANGRICVIGYSNDVPKTNPRPTIIEDNTFIECGMYMYKNANIELRRNTFTNGYAWFRRVDGLVIEDNHVLVERDRRWAYRFGLVTGRASGNLFAGEPFDIPLDESAPYSSVGGVPGVAD